jgi:hypothetical protein
MAWKDNQSKPHRTRIEDLSAIGDELSEEQLRGVSGGAMTIWTCVRGTYKNQACYEDTMEDCSI